MREIGEGEECKERRKWENVILSVRGDKEGLVVCERRGRRLLPGNEAAVARYSGNRPVCGVSVGWAVLSTEVLYLEYYPALEDFQTESVSSVGRFKGRVGR